MQHDIVGLIDEDHARLTELANALRACARPAAAVAQFNDFAVALGAHLSVLKRVIYPALKAVGWKNVSSSLLVGHAKLTQAFAELLTLKKADGLFADSLADLIDATGQVLERERTELLPMLAELLSPGERLAMAADAAQFLPEAARPPGRPASDPGRQSVRDWIEEARLLLGGMHSSASAQEPPGA
jgi:hypothetical protein